MSTIRSFFVLLICFFVPVKNDNVEMRLELVSVDRVWNNVYHNAFTSLTLFNDEFYIAFRQSQGHNSRDGKIKVIRLSNEGWKEVGTVSIKGKDLRDPNIIVNYRNQLILYAMSRTGDESKKSPHNTYSWVLEKGKFEGPYMDSTDTNTWKWGINRIGDDIMSIAYSGKDKKGTLYKTHNGYSKWAIVAKNIYPAIHDLPNECALIQLHDKSLLALLRKERGNKKAMIGKSTYPYKEWSWRELDKQVGGPSIIQLTNGDIYACVRLYGKVRTSLCRVDLVNNKLVEVYSLPSGHDTSYPDMIQKDDTLYVSYYSNHKTHRTLADIYFVKFKIL